MEDKPLPAIPLPSFPQSLDTSKPTKLRGEPHNNEKLTTLCVQARLHREKFIRFVLDEVSQELEGILDIGDRGWIERNKEELLWSIEDALDDLGRSVGQGGWLAGIRRARSLFENSNLNDSSSDEKDVKIRQLRDLAAQQIPPTPLPTSKHLLLSFAPVGSRVALPEEDTGFDIIPSQIRCTFKSGVFVFPDSEQQGNTLLYGYDDWSAALSHSSTPLRLVGGTFQFSGVPGSLAFHTVLSKVLKLTVYQQISLLLEQCLLSDAGITLSFPSPSSISASRHPRNTITLRNRVLSHGSTTDRHRSQSTEPKHSYTSDSGGQKQSQSKGHSSKPSLIPNSILSLFSKRSLGRSNAMGSQGSELPVAVRGGSLDLRENLEREPAHTRTSMDASASPPSPGGVTSPTSSVFGGRIRRFSFGASAFASGPNSSSHVQSLLSPNTPSASAISPPDVPPAAKHFTFANLVDRILETKDIFSTSPGVGKHVEIPELLVRLAERERETSVGKVRGDERVALKQLIGWNTNTNGEERDEGASAGGQNHGLGLGAGMVGIKGFLKHQALSALVSIHVPAAEGSTSGASRTASGTDEEVDDTSETEEDDTKKASSDGQPQHSSEGGGLADEKIKAIREQQATSSTSKALSGDPSPSSGSTTSLPQPMGTAQHRKRKARQKFLPCANSQPPRWETFLFRKTRMDGSDGSSNGACLGEMIQGWLEEADEPCSNGSILCGKAARTSEASSSSGAEATQHKGIEQRGSSDAKGKEKVKEEDEKDDGERQRTTTPGYKKGTARPWLAQSSAVGPCRMKRGKHEIRFMHGGIRVTVAVSELNPAKRRGKEGGKSVSSLGLVPPTVDSRGSKSTTSSPITAGFPSMARAKSDTNVPEGRKDPQIPDEGGEGGSKDGNDIEVWMRCGVCGRDNWALGRRPMSDGTFLLPFGKFLELMIYSPSFSKTDTALCDHLPVSLDSRQFHARNTSSPPALSPTEASTNLQKAAMSIALSNRDSSRLSTVSSTSSMDSRGPLPSPTSPVSASSSGRPFSRGLGWPGVGMVKKSSSLRNTTPHSSSYDEEQNEGVEVDDTTPTPSRIVSRRFPRSGAESTGGSFGEKIDETNPNKVETLPDMRFNVVRHFSNRTHTVSFSIDKIDEVFELRVPRVQIVRGSFAPGSHAQEATSSFMGGAKDEIEHEEEAEKKKLRREIKVWWEGVADHIEILESRLATGTQDSYISSKKSLPRLPSSDDAYDDFDEVQVQSPGMPPPKPEGLPPGSPITPTGKHAYFPSDDGSQSTESEDEESLSAVTPKGTPRQARAALPSMESNESLNSMASSSSASDTSVLSSSSSREGSVKDPSLLLSNLRQTFHRTEQSLYTQLSKTSPGSLNEVRRAFLSAAKGVERRLEAWQKKHMGLGLKVVNVKSHKDEDGRGETAKEREKEKSGKGQGKLSLCITEPEWWDKSCHVVPGGNIIVREDDWGSIIAFTLSTDAYRQELGAMSGVGSRPMSIMSETSLQSAATDSTAGSPPASSSFFSTTGYRLFRSSALSQPDPDQEDVIWHEPEAYSAVISRKEHPKDPTGLLSIREVLRQKAPAISDVHHPSIGGILSGSRIATLGREGSRLLSSALGSNHNENESRPNTASVPPSAWAKPDVQISKEAAGGEVVSGLPAGNTTDRIMQELDAVTSSQTISRPDSSMSYRSSEHWINPFEDAHIRRGKASSIISFESSSTVGPDDNPVVEGSDTGRLSMASAVANKGSYLPPPPVPFKDAASISADSSPRSSFSTFTSGLTTAMRAMLNNAPDAIPRPLSASRHHGLLSADIAPIDERPHIKYDWTVGKRLKFSCTVYYAKQFDMLRKRCGVDELFLKSLSKSQNWSAEGGKSKSNFWKTSDDRFIIKTLINAWNVADLQVLIDLAPSYFRYLDSTACKATVLAKLVGFYTIEIRNLETGNVQSKADLLVMENLFYNQNIDKTFDLKGIQGRKVKAGTSSSKTLFDGEWIEGQQQTLTLVRPHSKLVLREAIRNDADFLARSNIMDYSLLLGVDIKRKEIACGLVDTIGSYTFAKTLEYKAKQGLSAGGGKEVTVVPPAEYQERFVSALERYFLACPDKWSKPLDPESKITNDLDALSSVL